MADVFSARKRSEIMSRIHGKDTKPELLVRSIVHRLGFRFRVHQGKLPGNPDIVLKRHEKVIFVHGCFWHGHRKCKRASLPTSNRIFWRKKIEGNIKRDRKFLGKLRALGWHYLVVWTCQIKDEDKIRKSILTFMEKRGK